MMTSFERLTRTRSGLRRIVPVTLLAAGVLVAAAGVTRANDGSWTFPYTGATASNDAAFQVDNVGLGGAAKFRASNPDGSVAAIYSFNFGDGAGLYSVGFGQGDGVTAHAYEANGVTAYGARNGVSGTSSDGSGVNGRSERGNGVHGFSGTGAGVYGGSDLSYGVVGSSNAGLAGYFNGNVTVAGTLSKAAGSFKIDHPLDPENKFLSHSFVESPDMKNIYDGIATLDDAGVANVEMPVWFEALNRDYRYQLTAVGAPAPHLHVARGIAGHRFTIAGGPAGLEVSWQVTGIRQDAYAVRHPIAVEEDKAPEERGLYLNPEALGQPESRGIHYAHLRALAEPASSGDVQSDIDRQEQQLDALTEQPVDGSAPASPGRSR